MLYGMGKTSNALSSLEYVLSKRRELCVFCLFVFLRLLEEGLACGRYSTHLVCAWVLILIAAQ